MPREALMPHYDEVVAELHHKLGIVDNPDAHRVHGSPIPDLDVLPQPAKPTAALSLILGTAYGA